MILKGNLCDACGCIITRTHEDKIAVIGTRAPLFSPFVRYGCFKRRRMHVCNGCAMLLERRLIDWVLECDKAGEEERAKRILDFEQKYRVRYEGKQ